MKNKTEIKTIKRLDYRERKSKTEIKNSSKREKNSTIEKTSPLAATVAIESLVIGTDGIVRELRWAGDCVTTHELPNADSDTRCTQLNPRALNQTGPV